MAVDKSSLSNTDVVKIKHIDWNVHVDFAFKVLKATASYELTVNAKELILDTKDLLVRNVSCSGKSVSFQLKPAIPGKSHLGQSLVISLPANARTVTVDYETTLQCSALQFLPPAQTAGKEYPYMYSQCQAIHARSLIPCQDATHVKFTYRATVTTPSWATAVLSAVHVSRTVDEATKTAVAVWTQKIPISSYLLALAVGQLERRELSPRCAVYSEPGVVDAASYEFAETEAFLETAEKIAGTPYMWGRYDLLCLPPSFSYGGMENPCMTFVTPTLLAGDRSLAGVVAHEIAHSWTGNYVTCATWDHFWLNEGWTVWLERKISSRLRGSSYLDFQAIGGFKSLRDAVQVMPDEYTKLVLPIEDGDPDEAYSVVAYEKGFNLLLYLERKIVGTPKFEAFFQSYIEHYASKTLTSNDFRVFFVQHFSKDKEATAAIESIDWESWFHASGMPPQIANFDRSLAEASEHLASLWIAVDQSGSTLPIENVEGWSSGQKSCFLDEIIAHTEVSEQPLKISTIHAMRSLYGFSDTKNSELLLRFCRLAIAAEDTSIVPVVIRFITSQGRMKYIRPLYKALYNSEMGKEIAVKVFLEHRDFYHPIGAKMVAADLMVIKKTGRRLAVNQECEEVLRERRNLMWITTGIIVAVVAVSVGFSRRKQ